MTGPAAAASSSAEKQASASVFPGTGRGVTARTHTAAKGTANTDRTNTSSEPVPGRSTATSADPGSATFTGQILHQAPVRVVTLVSSGPESGPAPATTGASTWAP